MTMIADGCVRALVEAIHASPSQSVLYLCGGASQALGWLMSVPGASNTVLEVVVPYSRMSMIQLLGKVPGQFASRKTAEEMAVLAYNRALKLSNPGSPVVGVGFSGSLASARPKLGDHRYHLSTRISDRLWVSSVTLAKGLRSREEEDAVSSQSLLKALANACNIQTTLASKVPGFTVTEEYERKFDEDEELEQLVADACNIQTTLASEVPGFTVTEEYEHKFDEDEQLEQLIRGEISFKVYPFSHGTPNPERKIILSGSFNPLHDGHLRLLEVATSIIGNGYPCFELSAINADKPPLTIPEIKNRVKQFEKAGKSVIISNQPFFYKKAQLFPGSCFVIGADTAVRLINPKYYGNDYAKMLEILLECKNSECVFLVGGRNVDGNFMVLEDINIPEELKDMFVSIPPERFRVDISSTEIRNTQRL